MKSRSQSTIAAPFVAACVLVGFSSMSYGQAAQQPLVVPGAPAPQLLVPPAEKPPVATASVVPPSAAKPEPIKAPEAKAKKSEEQPTTIDAEESSLDPKTGVHIFKGNVVVHSPQFDLTTDGTLEVRMKQDKPKPADAEAKPSTSASPSPSLKAPVAPVKSEAVQSNQVAEPKVIAPGTPVSAAAKSDPKAGSDAKKAAEPESATSDIESADARGRMVNVQKKGADGHVKAGVGRHILYNGVTGVITLKEWPQVQDGPNLIIATEESTVMVLDSNNHLQVRGKSVTKLMPENDPNKKGAAK